ncbi:MAG: hypothetical protein RLZZ244_1410 [Verrucomicrobiota bacterium]
MSASDWYSHSVLSAALERILGDIPWFPLWSESPSRFLEWAADKTGMTTEAFFARLIVDREAESALGFLPVALDPAIFEARGQVAHPGLVGAYFLPLWVRDGVLTCVCHTPLLVPSDAALRVLASLAQVESVSVVYCLPWSFKLYYSALMKRHSIRAVSAGGEGGAPVKRATHARLALKGFELPLKLRELVPSRFQRRFEMVPVYSVEGVTVTLAVAQVPDLMTRTEIAGMLPGGYTVRYALADAVEIVSAISAATTSDVDMSQLASQLKAQGAVETASQNVERIDFRAIQQRSATSDTAPAVTLLQTLLLHAVRNDASDLHIARGETALYVEYRLDDWKYPYPETIPISFSEPILARIKVLSDMDLQKQNTPQFGRFVMDVTNVGEVEVRVTMMPTVYGDSATLRFARRNERLPSLVELGMGVHEAQILKRIVDGSYGLGLVVGPTGSGKSTTLYSLLGSIPADRYEVLSAEDPVERYLPGTKQTLIHKGLSYAQYLAGALRADPDYIHIGETRTPETAEQVMKAAETGHIVLTTLHTHQACAAPARMFGLGVEPYILADALMGVVAQQLLPKICPHCEEAAPAPPDETLRSLGIDPAWCGSAPVFKEGRGCPHCRGRGAMGRMLVAEGFYADSTIHELILKRRPLGEIREAQVAQGGLTLLQQGVRAAASGKIPLSVALALGSSAMT